MWPKGLWLYFKKPKQKMKTNATGIDLIKSFESLHDGDLSLIGLQPKMDPRGIWTEGYGRAMRYEGEFLIGHHNKELAYSLQTIHNEQEAIEALMEDLKSREEYVRKKVKVEINCNQFSALVSYVYNTGGSATLFRYINKKAPDHMIKEWFVTRYITSGGIFYRGLLLRRRAECDLYFTPCN